MGSAIRERTAELKETLVILSGRRLPNEEVVAKTRRHTRPLCYGRGGGTQHIRHVAPLDHLRTLIQS